MPSSPTPRRRAARTARRQTVPWPSWLPRCAGRCSPGPGLPREEGRRVLENVALLLQAPHALSQLAQLLALGAGQPVIALTAVALALAPPVTQRLLRHPQALSDIRDRAALTDQLQRLPPELLRIGRPCLGHSSPSLPRRFRRKYSGLRRIGGIPRASARSVLAWRFLPRNALVSAGSARCATTPMPASTSYTNNQPVHASTATSTCSPANCPT